MAIVEFDQVVYHYENVGASLPERKSAQASATVETLTQTSATAETPAFTQALSFAQTPALDGLSLSVEAGEFVAVIGANGSGKSTLARHINALLTPSAGRVLTCGLDTADPEFTFEIRAQAGYLFQNPDAQMVTSVVADDVAFGPENLAIPHAEIVERVDEALGSVAMDAWAERNPAHLSGGQKQRVCLAGVLAMRPNILILDEPGAMLDARGRRGIRRIVRELSRAKMTVILITHFMEEAVLAQRVIVMDHGRIALSGSPSEVFTNKQRLRELALDVPFSLLLAEQLRDRGLPISEIVTPEQLKEELCRWYASI
ncbi:MAG: energy-coupling factor transporter ATPase [Coriobacteriales bacterium]|nr:energy-coupling factor transporter ATPase [Coriobacteriales bacterium]